MNENKVVCYCQSKTGYIVDDQYCSIYHCAAMLSEEFKIDFDEAYKGIVHAIEFGNVYPKDSGFTFDYILTLEDVQQRELF